MADHLLLLAALLIFAAVMVTKLGARFGMPVMLLFLVIGMISGADVLGFPFEDYAMAESIGHFAMAVILFTAALGTKFQHTRPLLWEGIVLSIGGVVLMTALTGTFIYLVLAPTLGGGAPTLLSCLLLGAILSSTDATSVSSVLGQKRLHLRENLGSLLELESGSNDPIAMALTVILVQLIPMGADTGTGVLLLSGFLRLLLQLAIGLAVGVAIGYGSAWFLGKIQLSGSSLYAILILSLGFLATSLADLLGGNGLLAIYVAALIIGNRARIPFRKEVMNFFNGTSWLMQLVMFLMLGLLARPSRMAGVLLPGCILAFAMMLVFRPLSVFASLGFSRKLSFKAKLFTSWVGIKGAGPILFAMYPVVSGLKGGDQLFNVVFLVTLLSLMLQGSTLSPMARWLKLSYEEDPQVESFGIEIPEELGIMRDHVVSEDDLAVGNTLRDLCLPHGIRVVMIGRGDKHLVPHGSMVLYPGDHLLILMGESDDS